jgi:hypothetical protein
MPNLLAAAERKACGLCFRWGNPVQHGTHRLRMGFVQRLLQIPEAARFGLGSRPGRGRRNFVRHQCRRGRGRLRRIDQRLGRRHRCARGFSLGFFLRASRRLGSFTLLWHVKYSTANRHRPTNHRLASRCCLSSSRRASISGSSCPAMILSRLKFFSAPPSPPRR